MYPCHIFFNKSSVFLALCNSQRHRHEALRRDHSPVTTTVCSRVGIGSSTSYHCRHDDDEIVGDTVSLHCCREDGLGHLGTGVDDVVVGSHWPVFWNDLFYQRTISNDSVKVWCIVWLRIPRCFYGSLLWKAWIKLSIRFHQAEMWAVFRYRRMSCAEPVYSMLCPRAWLVSAVVSFSL